MAEQIHGWNVCLRMGSSRLRTERRESRMVKQASAAYQARARWGQSGLWFGGEPWS